MLFVTVINIVILYEGLLSGRESWIKVHIDAAIRLLKVWSQKSHLLHSSDQQLDYIDCALLCFFKYARFVSKFFNKLYLGTFEGGWVLREEVTYEVLAE